MNNFNFKVTYIYKNIVVENVISFCRLIAKKGNKYKKNLKIKS